MALALARRGTGRWALGRAGWRDDYDRALAMARSADPMSHARVLAYAYGSAIPAGVLLADDAALRDIEEALETAERSGEDISLCFARMTLGLALVHRESPAERDRGLAVLGRSATCDWRGGSSWPIYLWSRSAWLVRRLSAEIAMAPYRSCARP